MRVLSTLLVSSLLTLGATGCSFATTSVAGNSNVDGEAWYVRTTGIGALVFSTKVYYCPPPRAAGPVTCKEAKMNDEGGDFEMPSMPGKSEDNGNAAPSDNGGGEAKPSAPAKKQQNQQDQQDQEDQEDN